MSSHPLANRHHFSVALHSKIYPLVIVFISIVMLGCVTPEITEFEVAPRIFCASTDVQVEWKTKDVETIALKFNDVVVTEENDGVEIIRNLTESGVISLVAKRPSWAAKIEQEVVLFSGHHDASFSTTGCVGRGTPTGTMDVVTDLPLIVFDVTGRSLPITVTHRGETHVHESGGVPFNVWDGKVMRGSWEVTGTPQIGRNCSTGALPEPKSLTVLGSCNGEPAGEPQSVTPPEAVPITAVQSVLLRCNGDESNSSSRIFQLWIQEPSGCVVQEPYLANSYAEAAGCAQDESKTVVGDVTDVSPGPVTYHTWCGNPRECSTFEAFSSADARECARASCPGSDGAFGMGRCNP